MMLTGFFSRNLEKNLIAPAQQTNDFFKARLLNPNCAHNRYYFLQGKGNNDDVILSCCLHYCEENFVNRLATGMKEYLLTFM